MEDIIFLTKPKVFSNLDGTTYTIEGISAKLNNSHEVVIGNNDPINVELKFWTKADDTFTQKGVFNGRFHKEYEVPNIGTVKAMSGLLSPVKQEIYQVASLVAVLYGYELLPFEEQVHLNA